MLLTRLAPLITAALYLAACSPEKPEYTEQQRLCISQRFNGYDPRKLQSCLDVCLTCMNGTVATCNSSCKLKGAT